MASRKVPDNNPTNRPLTPYEKPDFTKSKKQKEAQRKVREAENTIFRNKINETYLKQHQFIIVHLKQRRSYTWIKNMLWKTLNGSWKKTRKGTRKQDVVEKVFDKSLLDYQEFYPRMVLLIKKHRSVILVMMKENASKSVILKKLVDLRLDIPEANYLYKWFFKVDQFKIKL